MQQPPGVTYHAYRGIEHKGRMCFNVRAPGSKKSHRLYFKRVKEHWEIDVPLLTLLAAELGSE